MSFHEKSAWIMSFALLLCGAYYFKVVASLSAAAGELAGPALPLLAEYTIVMVVIAIIGHITIAIMAPRDTDSSLDERERVIVTRAGNVSRYVIGSGVVLSLMLYLLTDSGDQLFYSVLASLMIAHLSEYLLQIVFSRTAL